MNYDSFAEECVDDLKVLQDKFNNDYNLDGYENWFYSQVTGLLTFSTGIEEINFLYFDVGSFSQEARTWMWAWANEHNLDNVRDSAAGIREFGQEEQFSKLTSGCFVSDEFEAWEFLAIAAKLANGIGVYRPVNNSGLQHYFVILKHIDNETAKSIKDRYVECCDHEYRRRAFVCHHLTTRKRVGFEEAFETFEGMELYEDDDFQAWCNECERVRVREGGWNEISMAFTKTKVVCEKCYFEMKELNLTLS